MSTWIGCGIEGEKNEHVTLAFLGDVEDKDISSLAQVVATYVNTQIYLKTRPIFQIGEVDFFGKNRNIRVLLIDPEPFNEVFDRMYLVSLIRIKTEIGVNTTFEFKPHVTTKQELKSITINSIFLRHNKQKVVEFRYFD